MIKIILTLIALLCFALLVSWYLEPSWRETIESASSIFSLLASIVTLTIFIQFYQTYIMWKQSENERERASRAQFTARMTALASEILSNIQTCKMFESEREFYLTGNITPNIRFRYDVSANLIRTGEVTHHKLRAELMSLITQMEALNAMVDMSFQQMIMRPAVDPARLQAMNEWSIRNMEKFLEKITHVRKQLANTETLYDEFWKDPQKFNDETYLHDHLIPDALIR